MADCECLPKCAFFHDRMKHMPAMSEVWKLNYCQGDSSRCARHVVFLELGKEGVPADLFPNELERAGGVLQGIA